MNSLARVLRRQLMTPPLDEPLRHQYLPALKNQSNLRRGSANSRPAGSSSATSARDGVCAHRRHKKRAKHSSFCTRAATFFLPDMLSTVLTTTASLRRTAFCRHAWREGQLVRSKAFHGGKSCCGMLAKRSTTDRSSGNHSSSNVADTADFDGKVDQGFELSAGAKR